MRRLVSSRIVWVVEFAENATKFEIAITLCKFLVEMIACMIDGKRKVRSQIFSFSNEKHEFALANDKKKTNKAHKDTATHTHTHA